MPTAKHFLSACMIAKDEADYLIEWIAFHRVVGFDYFYFYDNDSTDATASLLKGLERAGICDYRPWPRAAFPNNPQVHAYRDALTKVDTDWLAIVDADEFVVPLYGASVAKLLAERFADAAAVLCNWRMFGSAGLTAADGRPCIERFIKSSVPAYHSNRNVKSIVRPEAVRLAHIHNHELAAGHAVLSDGSRVEGPYSNFFDPPLNSSIEINHYYCKTPNEFDKKRAKGLADYPLDATNAIRPRSQFMSSDTNDMDNLSAFRFADATKSEIMYLLNLLN